MIDDFIEGNHAFLEMDFEHKKERYMTLTESQHPEHHPLPGSAAQTPA